MLIELDKKGLITLINGTSIGYELMDNPKVKWCGSYRGGFYDDWKWDVSKLTQLTEEQLYELYKIVKS